MSSFDIVFIERKRTKEQSNRDFTYKMWKFTDKGKNEIDGLIGITG